MGVRSNQPTATALPDSDNNWVESEALHRRLTHLESTISRVLNPQRHKDQTSLNWSLSTVPSSVDTPEESLDPESGTEDDTSPLLAVWRDAMAIDPIQSPLNTASARLFKPPVLSSHPPLPDFRGLDILFKYTEPFWTTWPACTFGIIEPKQLAPGQLRYNSEIIYEAVDSGDTLLTSKAFLWLILCLTQFPRRHTQELHLPKPRRKLIEQYHAYVRSTFDTALDSGDSICGLECYNLQWKIFFDTGKPRKAWQILRNGITSAIQLGLHRTDSHRDERKKDLWMSFWQTERQISCMLGLPSCTSNEHPGTGLKDLSSNDPIEIAHHRLSIISGDIIKRDQTSLKENYAVTTQIDQDLEDALSILPPEVWSLPQAGQSFAVIYHQLSTRMRFWTAQKLLHMPYMLRSMKESRYQYSYTKAIDASRNMISTLYGFRQVCSDFLCEVVDFQAFSAAVVILLGVLAQRGATANESEQDWKLIEKASKCLRQTATALECSVARQGADALDTLMAACRGTPPQEPFVVTIPYFGRVRLK